MGLADKGLISGSSSEGLDSTPQQGQHGPLRQMLETAVRVETPREGRVGMEKVKEKEGEETERRG